MSGSFWTPEMAEAARQYEWTEDDAEDREYFARADSADMAVRD
jgi:hypothetical protein